MAIWPSIFGRQYLEGNTSLKVLKNLEASISKYLKKYLEIESNFSISILGQKYLRNALSGRAHASEETLISNRFLWDNVAPAMEGDQSSRDMTAFGYRQKNYAQGCRQNNFEELRSSDQGAIIWSNTWLKSKRARVRQMQELPWPQNDQYFDPQYFFNLKRAKG